MLNSSSSTATRVTAASESQAGTVSVLALVNSSAGTSGKTDAKQRFKRSSIPDICGFLHAVEQLRRLFQKCGARNGHARLRSFAGQLLKEILERAVARGGFVL